MLGVGMWVMGVGGVVIGGRKRSSVRWVVVGDGDG